MGDVAFNFTDLLDVLFVAALLYTLIVWIRRTQAAFVAIGIVILGAFSILARAMDLRLTAWLFQGFFAIFLVIIVVIFQEELRQLFERVALWTLPQRRRHRRLRNDGAAAAADVLVPALADLARDRIGALVVFPGRQPVARHIRGGIELDAKISAPLVKSIFDPHSAGHDGAMIVEGDRVSRFAAHLPLSENFQQLAGVGTRHSAALGLAELSDALSVVVSEERGRISVARDGKLRQLDDAAELGAVVRRFLGEKGPRDRRSRTWMRQWRQNWAYAAASLMLAVALWYLFVPGSRPEEVTYQVPVTVENLPAQLVLDKVEPEAVEVTFSGPRRAFYLFDPRRVAVAVDGSRAEVGRTSVDISDQNVRYPRELTLETMRPERVRMWFRRADAPPAEAPPSTS
jgi:diadenylate cyclase